MSSFAALVAFDVVLPVVMAATYCSHQSSFSSLRPLSLSFFKADLSLPVSLQMSWSLKAMSC